LTLTEAMAAAPYFLDSDLRAEPFFRPGGFWTKVATWQYDPATKTNSWSKERLRELYEPTAGSAFAFRHRDALLVRMIPAMSPAAGLIPVPRLKPQGDPEEHNFDMSSPVIRGPAESWPLPPVRNDNKWRHSDLREVAYPYVRGLYDMIAEKGNLKDNLKGINP